MEIRTVFDDIANKLDIQGQKIPEIIYHDGQSQVIRLKIYINKQHIKDERFYKKVLSHEIVHYLVFKKYGQLIGSLDEGLAVYIADNEFYKKAHRFTVHEFSKALLEKDILYKIKNLIDNRRYYGRRHDMRVDIEAASFVGFLLESYGKEPFFKMYNNIIMPTRKKPVCNIFKVLKNVYEKSIDDLQKDWEEFLRTDVKKNTIPDKILKGKKFYKRIPIRKIHCHSCAFPIEKDQNVCPNCGLEKNLQIK